MIVISCILYIIILNLLRAVKVYFVISLKEKKYGSHIIDLLLLVNTKNYIF